MIYLALAYSRKQLAEWLRRNGIRERSVRYIESMQDVRGVQDFGLILLSGWDDHEKEEREAVARYLFSKRPNVYNADYRTPIVNGQGIIQGWRKNDDD